ncbi:MAG: AEC family transporter [Candidatus Heimdallarchaeota archaeon]
MPFLEGFLELLSRLFIIYLVISLGIMWRFSRFFKPEYGEWFTKVTIWVFFPISIIASFAKVTTFTGNVVIQVVIVAIMVHLASYISIRIIQKNQPKVETGAFVLCATFPNSIFFPFPIILAVVGTPALLYATIFLFMAMIMRNSLGAAIGIWHRPETTQSINNKQKSPIKVDLKKFAFTMIKFPPFIALVIGFLFYWIYGPQIIGAIPGLEIIKNFSLYGALILVGISFNQLNQLSPKNIFSTKTFQVAFTRFLVAPSVALVLLITWDAPAIVALPLLIQSMAPPAVSVIIYGKFFHFSESDVSLLITSLTFFSLLVLPFELLVFLELFPLS